VNYCFDRNTVQKNWVKRSFHLRRQPPIFQKRYMSSASEGALPIASGDFVVSSFSQKNGVSIHLNVEK